MISEKKKQAMYQKIIHMTHEELEKEANKAYNLTAYNGEKPDLELHFWYGMVKEEHKHRRDERDKIIREARRPLEILIIVGGIVILIVVFIWGMLK